MRATQIVIAATCMSASAGGCASTDSVGPDDGGAEASRAPDAGTRVDAAAALKDGAVLDARAGLEAGAGLEDGEAPGPDAGPPLPPMPLVRFANWAPDAPAVDFCIAPHGTAQFAGPLVSALGTSSDAGGAGLTYPLVSAYSRVNPGQYDVRVVVSGSGTCAVGIAPDATGLPALGNRTATTLALVGKEVPSAGAPGLKVLSFADERASATPLVQVRFINAAPSVGEADLLVSTASSASPSPPASFTPLFVAVPFGRAAGPQGAGPDSGAIDTNGYRSLSPQAQVVFGARATGAATSAPDLVDEPTTSALASNVLTVVLVGPSGAAPSLALFECLDNAGTVGPLSDCFFLPR